MIRRTFLALIALVALPGMMMPAFALDRALTPEEEQLIRDIGTHNSAIRTMAGRFLQIDGAGNRTEGTFFLERPDKVNFRYGPPSREEIVSQGRGFYVLNREEETKYAYPQNTVPLRQFLGDQIDLLSANISDVVMTDTFISISLYDESPMGTVEVALIFDIESKDLWQWTLTEPNGEELTFSIYDVVKDVEIPRAFFSIPANYSAATQ